MPEGLEFWQVLAISSVPALLAALIPWVLNRRRDGKREDATNDQTVVTTMTGIVEQLRTELSRATQLRNQTERELEHVNLSLRALAQEIDTAARSIARHRQWDEDVVSRDADLHPVPLLPTLPRSWEIMDRARPPDEPY